MDAPSSETCYKTLNFVQTWCNNMSEQFLNSLRIWSKDPQVHPPPWADQKACRPAEQAQGCQSRTSVWAPSTLFLLSRVAISHRPGPRGVWLLPGERSCCPAVTRGCLMRVANLTAAEVTVKFLCKNIDSLKQDAIAFHYLWEMAFVAWGNALLTIMQEFVPSLCKCLYPGKWNANLFVFSQSWHMWTDHSPCCSSAPRNGSHNCSLTHCGSSTTLPTLSLCAPHYAHLSFLNWWKKLMHNCGHFIGFHAYICISLQQKCIMNI